MKQEAIRCRVVARVFERDHKAEDENTRMDFGVG